MSSQPTDPGTVPRPSRRGGATVTFEHVTKRYDAGVKGPGAVNDLSFSVPAGKICVLVGPSGCGKTTSLKMVNRLIEPTSGRILIDGVDAATRDVTELRRGIGYVIQQVGLFPHQTDRRQRGRRAAPAGLVGGSPARARGRAARPGRPRSRPATADRFPSQLSGGERQRVGVARALAADPPVMLMDEPFGAVDPIVRERLQNEFLRLQQDLAKTILFVTHDIDEAIKMGDLVAVMQVGGVLAQFAPPEEILAQPASDFVARFVGADRGLKRLSLTRVRDLPPHPAVTARPGDDAARRPPAHPGRPVPLPPAGRRGRTRRSAGWTSARSPPSGTLTRRRRALHVAAVRAPRRRSRTPSRCSSTNEVQAGIVVDRRRVAA